MAERETLVQLAEAWHQVFFSANLKQSVFLHIEKALWPSEPSNRYMFGCVDLYRFIYSPFDLFLFLPVEEGWDSYAQAGDPLIRSVPLCLDLFPVILLKKPSLKSVRLLGGQTIALPPRGSTVRASFIDIVYVCCHHKKGSSGNRGEKGEKGSQGYQGLQVSDSRDNDSWSLVCSYCKMP